MRACDKSRVAYQDRAAIDKARTFKIIDCLDERLLGACHNLGELRSKQFRSGRTHRCNGFGKKLVLRRWRASANAAGGAVKPGQVRLLAGGAIPNKIIVAPAWGNRIFRDGYGIS